MRLRDVARSVHEGGAAGRREQCGFRPEIDCIADRQSKRVGEVACLEPARFGIGDVACGQWRTAKGLERDEVEIEREEPLRRQLDAFIECAATGRAPKVSGFQAAAALELAVEITKRINA
jgi:predicted dehydrogenase